MKDIFIIGAGGVGKETAWIIEEINKREAKFKIVGFIDDNVNIIGQYVNGYKVLGNINYLKNNFKKSSVVIAIANYKLKKDIVQKLEKDFVYEKIIYPGVNINENIKIQEGTIIYPGVIMTTNISIGKHVIISPKCGIGHDSIIKDYVCLLWNVNISGHDIIEEGVLMGSGSTVIQNKKIKNGVVVGAGAVVIKDLKAYTTNVGIPTRELKNEKDIICNHY